MFVTVGTTQFDKLVNAMTSPVAMDWMASQGYDRLTIQHGRGKAPSFVDGTELQCHAYDFKDSLEDDICSADLIVSHAGAGTIMEVLGRSDRKKLIVTINTDLMDNHQLELANAMAERGYLMVVECPERLLDDGTVNGAWRRIAEFEPVPHPGGDDTSFPRLLNGFLGIPGAGADAGSEEQLGKQSLSAKKDD